METQLGSVIRSGPMTSAIDGKQHVSVAADAAALYSHSSCASESIARLEFLRIATGAALSCAAVTRVAVWNDVDALLDGGLRSGRRGRLRRSVAYRHDSGRCHRAIITLKCIVRNRRAHFDARTHLRQDRAAGA